MEKLLRGKKVFGRCRVKGHGCHCEVSHEIQSTPIERALEKRALKKEIKGEVAEWFKALPC